MFGKKCSKCNRKISKDFEFCPYCGYNIKKERNERDFGFLGKNDDFTPNFGLRIPSEFNKLFGSIIKQLDEQFKELDREIGRDFKEVKPNISRGISISISSGTGKEPEIKVRRFNPEFQGFKKLIRQQAKEIKIPAVSEEQVKRFAKLPREEAETKVRRLSNRIIYEIDLPGVSDLNNILINKLENSIEIKAFSQDKVYVKLLPVRLQILSYKLEDEKLVLELATR